MLKAIKSRMLAHNLIEILFKASEHHEVNIKVNAKILAKKSYSLELISIKLLRLEMKFVSIIELIVN